MMFFKSALTVTVGIAGINAFSPQTNFLSPTFVTSTSARTGTGTELSAGVFDNLFSGTEKSVATQGINTLTIPPPDQISEGQVRSLFYLWNDALATGDSRLVARRYASDAVLLPTVSDEPRTDYDSIKDYFDTFLKFKPQGVITDGNIKMGEGWAKDSGLYEFTMGADGSKVKARYSFLYTYDEASKTWRIAHHHSSFMPESMTVGAKFIEDDETRLLFQLWNDALATEDPDAVASRYAKNAVLLPTVSDEPRTDYDGIKDYFVNFLKLKPQGTILESHVTSGPDWAEDVGIYLFKMGKDGSEVKARYSFVYIFEDGQWKIAHHHSSTMPESAERAVEGTVISDNAVKRLFGIWNDALATLNAETVAKYYSRDAVLLPTVSDQPRTDHDGIKDYFENFLQLKPQSTILESHITSGPNWAKDVGVYSFKMGANGSEVKARYSFEYTLEDGAWKISHHHSSAMPESPLTGSKGEVISEQDVKRLFGLWNDALATLDPDTVAKRYSRDAVLLPTVSDQPRTDYDGIKDYFENFLQLKPQGTILESHVTTGVNWAKDVGVYSFKMGANGSEVTARYSFVYTLEDGAWKILHHHSSAMPESNAGKAISEDQVRGLFHLWNDALATLDSDAVAMRYSKNAVLLPTVSDNPRSDYNSIKEYFDNFLERKPLGKILESHVTIGKDWCKDVGTYEFTMGDGSNVTARYTFVYVWEEHEDGEGQWLISHHHSSMMPEPLLASLEKTAAEKEVEAKEEPVDTRDPAVTIMEKVKRQKVQTRKQALGMRQVNGGC